MMPAHKFISEIISSSTNIAITRPSLPIAAEISRQLEQYKNFSIKKIIDTGSDKNISHFNVLIHFVGFDKSSFAETLYHTTVLHRLLDQSLANKAKFILVLPEPVNSLKETAISLVTQFGKIFKLDYRIIALEPKADLRITAEEIIKTFVHKHKYVAVETPEPVKLAKHEPLKKNNNLTRWLLILSTVVGLYLINILLIGVLIMCTTRGLNENNWKQASLCSAPISTMIFLTGLESSSSTLSLLSNLNHTIYEVSLWVDQGLSISEGVWGTNELSDSTIAAWSEAGVSLVDQLAYLEPQFSVMPPGWINPTQIVKTKQVINNLNLTSSALRRLVMREQGKILLLLQDNTEIRPTGGYLSDVAIVSLEKGKVKGIDFYDTESLDSLLRGEVAPPDDFREVTGQTSWYLRDSNWEASFPESAKRTAWFIEKELDIKVDWVVGANLNLLKTMLEIGGPISVQGTEINSENLAIKHLELSRPDVSVSVIGQTAEELFKKWPEYPQTSKNMILVQFLEQLDSRQLVMYELNSPDEVFGLAMWDGGLRKKDTFYAVDSNIGANRANHYVQARQNLDVNIMEKEILTEWKLVYENSSPGSTWPAGDYKNYIRFYFPNNYQLKTVKINDRTLNSSEFTLSSDGILNIVGTGVTVKSRDSLSVGIQLSQTLGEEQRLAYRLELLNQPGRFSFPTNLRIKIPRGWVIDYRSPSLVASGSEFTYNANLLAPEVFQMELVTNNGK
jgi:hypothetical protein